MTMADFALDYTRIRQRRAMYTTPSGMFHGGIAMVNRYGPVLVRQVRDFNPSGVDCSAWRWTGGCMPGPGGAPPYRDGASACRGETPGTGDIPCAGSRERGQRQAWAEKKGRGAVP